jgi:hypothetical protein
MGAIFSVPVDLGADLHRKIQMKFFPNQNPGKPRSSALQKVLGFYFSSVSLIGWPQQINIPLPVARSFTLLPQISHT